MSDIWERVTHTREGRLCDVLFCEKQKRKRQHLCQCSQRKKGILISCLLKRGCDEKTKTNGENDRHPHSLVLGHWGELSFGVESDEKPSQWSVCHCHVTKQSNHNTNAKC